MGDKLPEIVLVEDNVDDERLVERALRKSAVPHQLVILRDGEEAATWLAARTANPDIPKAELPRLILMDHRVPKISGLELLRQIRADHRLAAVPVVMMSSGAEHRDLTEYYVAGANSVITKSVDWTEAMEKLPKTVEYWLSIHKTGS